MVHVVDEIYIIYAVPLQMMVYSTLTAFLLLVSTSLVLDVAVGLRRREAPSVHGKLRRFCDVYTTCGNIEAAGVSTIEIKIVGYHYLL